MTRISISTKDQSSSVTAVIQPGDTITLVDDGYGVPPSDGGTGAGTISLTDAVPAAIEGDAAARAEAPSGLAFEAGDTIVLIRHPRGGFKAVRRDDRPGVDWRGACVLVSGDTPRPARAGAQEILPEILSEPLPEGPGEEHRNACGPTPS
jgi:hypothetical protein